MRGTQRTEAFHYLEAPPYGVRTLTSVDGRMWVDWTEYNKLRAALANIEGLSNMEDTVATWCIRQAIRRAGEPV